jgi:hypothetical protein
MINITNEELGLDEDDTTVDQMALDEAKENEEKSKSPLSGAK